MTSTVSADVLQDPALLWYVNRSAGLVLLVLLTLATALGIASVDRRTRARPGPPGVRRTRPVGRFPGFVLPELHRRVALVCVALLGLHVVPAVLDDYVPIDWLDVVVPFVSEYRPLWLGLGVLAADLLAAVVITALLRRRLGPLSWKAVHRAVYLAWPLTLLHVVGMGTDVDDGLAALLVVGCVGAVVVALALRLRALVASDRAARSAGARRG